MSTRSSPVRFGPHVIGGDPIATNRAQILTPNFIEKPNNTLLDRGIEHKTSSVK